MPYNPSSKRHISYASFGLLVGTGTTSLRQSLPIQRPDVRNPNDSIGAKAPAVYSAGAFSVLAVMAAVRGHASAWSSSWGLGFLTPRTAATFVREKTLVVVSNSPGTAS